MTAWMAGGAAAALWELAAVAFLVGVVLGVRKGRARSKRLFRDEPLQRLQGLHPDTRIDHRWDA